MRNLQLETVISNRCDCLYRAQSNSTVTLRLIYVTYLLLSFPIHELLLFHDLKTISVCYNFMIAFCHPYCARLLLFVSFASASNSVF